MHVGWLVGRYDHVKHVIIFRINYDDTSLPFHDLYLYSNFFIFIFFSVRPLKLDFCYSVS